MSNCVTWSIVERYSLEDSAGNSLADYLEDGAYDHVNRDIFIGNSSCTRQVTCAANFVLIQFNDKMAGDTVRGLTRLPGMTLPTVRDVLLFGARQPDRQISRDIIGVVLDGHGPLVLSYWPPIGRSLASASPLASWSPYAAFLFKARR